jgi:hypothetical protein
MTRDMERDAGAGGCRGPAGRSTPGRHATGARPGGFLTPGPRPVSHDDVLRLQQAVGNRAVQRMLTPRPPAASARPAPVIQRYEAGEHIRFGDVYEVKPGETVYRIATRFGVTRRNCVRRTGTGSRHGHNRTAGSSRASTRTTRSSSPVGRPAMTLRRPPTRTM